MEEKRGKKEKTEKERKKEIREKKGGKKEMNKFRKNLDNIKKAELKRETENEQSIRELNETLTD